jgi:hypothetical protein
LTGRTGNPEIARFIPCLSLPGPWTTQSFEAQLFAT